MPLCVFVFSLLVLFNILGVSLVLFVGLLLGSFHSTILCWKIFKLQTLSNLQVNDHFGPTGKF